jgi:hypothetical protein
LQKEYEVKIKGIRVESDEKENRGKMTVSLSLIITVACIKNQIT